MFFVIFPFWDTGVTRSFVKGTVRPHSICNEWYHWIGFWKDVNRYRFLNFYFDLEFLKRVRSTEALNKKMAPIYSFFGGLCTVESFFLIGWVIYFLMCCSILVWIAGCWNFSNILLASCYPKNNCWLSRIFWTRFCGKDCGLCPCNPSAGKLERLEVFLYEAAQKFELFSNIQDQN